MTADVFDRIQDKDMITIRADGVVSYGSQLETELGAEVLDMLLTIVQDNIRTDPDDSNGTVEWIESVAWDGVERDAKVAGILEVS